MAAEQTSTLDSGDMSSRQARPQRSGRNGNGRIVARANGAVTQWLADKAPDDRQLSQALGWFSIGLGLTEILAPRALGRAIGIGNHPTVLRLLGMREIVSGVGLLSQRDAGAWA